jgi:hypothetical protein
MDPATPTTNSFSAKFEAMILMWRRVSRVKKRLIRFGSIIKWDNWKIKLGAKAAVSKSHLRYLYLGRMQTSF